MKQFKIMIAILIMATAGVSLATSDTTILSDTYTLDNQTGDAYAEGAFNFTEDSDQTITSTITGGVVTGDTTTSTGDVIQVADGAIYSTGTNGGVNQVLSATSGSIVNGGNIGGHLIDVNVPVYTYTEQFQTNKDGSFVYEDIDGVSTKISTGFAKVQDRVTQADVNADSSLTLGAPKTILMTDQWVCLQFN